MVTSKWLPHHAHCPMSDPEALPPSVLSLLCSPPTNQGSRQCTPVCPGQAGAVSVVSHTTQGSRVAYPELIILGT